MAINPLGPLKLLNFKDRVPKAVQKWRLGICLKCEKAELGICTSCFCPLASKSWIASERCPIGKWGVFPPGHSSDDEDSQDVQNYLQQTNPDQDDDEAFPKES